MRNSRERAQTRHVLLRGHTRLACFARPYSKAQASTLIKLRVGRLDGGILKQPALHQAFLMSGGDGITRRFKEPS